MITLRRLGIATVLAVTATAAPSIPAAATTTPVAATAVYVPIGPTCPGPPHGFEDFDDYDPLFMSGDLEGCWYTKIDRFRDLGSPSGLYFEIGREVFVGRFRGAVGSFSTVYTFESQWDPDAATPTEIWGRCQHTIVRGSGTGGLHGVSGFLGRIDIVTDGSARYRGFVRQP